MLVVGYGNFCKGSFDMDNDSFIEWVRNTFNLLLMMISIPLIMANTSSNCKTKSHDIC